MIKSMTERIHSGDLYFLDDEEITRQQLKARDKVYDYNNTRPSEFEKRQELLKEMFAEVGENCVIEPPFHATWGGQNVHFGNNVRAGFNLTLMDDTHIYVGDHTIISPNVTIVTAGIPILPELREKNYQYNAPVRIGKNCFIGAGTIIIAGVTIGDNTVIGAGSIVAKDFPPNVVARGNPCKVIRWITQRDSEFFFKKKRILWTAIDADVKNSNGETQE